MIPEQELREKLRKIESLFAGASTFGERAAAGAARERILAKLKEIEGRERPIEMKFTFSDHWQKKLFSALCQRYNLHPYRYHGQRYTTLQLKIVESFVNEILWPEYTQLSKALKEYLEEATTRIIREEIFKVEEEEECIEEKCLS